jgi:hypothetical protein
MATEAEKKVEKLEAKLKSARELEEKILDILVQYTNDFPEKPAYIRTQIKAAASLLFSITDDLTTDLRAAEVERKNG